MSQHQLAHALARARVYRRFLTYLIGDPITALAGYDIAADERHALLNRDYDRLIGFDLPHDLVRWWCHEAPVSGGIEGPAD